jgi:hypothetical protein
MIFNFKLERARVERRAVDVAQLSDREAQSTRAVVDLDARTEARHADRLHRRPDHRPGHAHLQQLEHRFPSDAQQLIDRDARAVRGDVLDQRRTSVEERLDRRL